MASESTPSGGGKPRTRGTRVLVDADGADVHQRAHTRLSVEFSVVAHHISSAGDVGPGIQATCRDISQGGFGVICKRVMYAEQMLAVVVPQKTGTPRVLFGVVRNVRYAEGGQYHLGLQMKATPQTPAVRSWLESLGIVRRAA